MLYKFNSLFRRTLLKMSLCTCFHSPTPIIKRYLFQSSDPETILQVTTTRNALFNEGTSVCTQFSILEPSQCPSLQAIGTHNSLFQHYCSFPCHCFATASTIAANYIHWEKQVLLNMHYYWPTCYQVTCDTLCKVSHVD